MTTTVNRSSLNASQPAAQKNKKHKHSSSKVALTKTGLLSDDIYGCQKLLKTLTSSFRFCGDFFAKGTIKPIMLSYANTFKAADDLIIATEAIAQLSALTNKNHKGQYLWQSFSLELFKTLTYLTASVGALRVYLSKLNIWKTDYVTHFTVLRNVALIASSAFGAIIRLKKVVLLNSKMNIKACWIKAEKLTEAKTPSEKQALKTAKVFASHYKHKKKAAEKGKSADKDRYQLYLDQLNGLTKSNAVEKLKHFCELKQIDHAKAKDDSLGNYLGYKAHNAKLSNNEGKSKRVIESLGILNEVLKITVIAMGTVFMFTPVGKALQLTISIIGLNVNSLALFRFFFDKKKFPVYKGPNGQKVDFDAYLKQKTSKAVV